MLANTLRAMSLGALISIGLFGASTANATELQFTYTEQNGINFTFDQSSSPVPISYSDGVYTDVSVTNWSGNIGPYSDIIWYSSGLSGEFDTSDSSYVVFGPQIYSGPESAPVFAPGVFSASDQTNGLSGTLTVTAFSNGAVPEPATWTLMLFGFGMVGAALRKRATVRTKLSYG